MYKLLYELVYKFKFVLKSCVFRKSYLRLYWNLFDTKYSKQKNLLTSKSNVKFYETKFSFHHEQMAWADILIDEI